MNHPFIASQLDKTKCSTCKRGLIDHTKGAQCESCDKFGPCDIFDDMLLCDSCRAKHESSLKEVIVSNEHEITSVIERARALDKNIRLAGDIFNAQTISNNEIRIAVYSDEKLNESEKALKYQSLLMERIQTFDAAIFTKNTELHELENQRLATITDLRKLGNDLRSEFREKIRASDATYQPIQTKKVEPKVKRATVDPFERMAQNLQTMKAQQNILITLDEAREILRKNMKG